MLQDFLRYYWARNLSNLIVCVISRGLIEVIFLEINAISLWRYVTYHWWFTQLHLSGQHFFAYQGASYIRDLMVIVVKSQRKWWQIWIMINILPLKCSLLLSSPKHKVVDKIYSKCWSNRSYLSQIEWNLLSNSNINRDNITMQN